MDSRHGERIIEQLPKPSKELSRQKENSESMSLLLHLESGYAGQNFSNYVFQILCDSFGSIKLHYT